MNYSENELILDFQKRRLQGEIENSSYKLKNINERLLEEVKYNSKMTDEIEKVKVEKYIERLIKESTEMKDYINYLQKLLNI